MTSGFGNTNPQNPNLKKKNTYEKKNTCEFDEGYDAYLEHETINNCEYEQGTIEWRRWVAGWYSAQEEDNPYLFGIFGHVLFKLWTQRTNEDVVNRMTKVQRRDELNEYLDISR
jgi:hypothetical protein